MELHHLRYFVAVAERLSFSRAAEALHLAQPSLSRQVKSLEEELGVQLFDRSKNRVNLTEEGRLFLENAKHLLVRSAAAVQAVKEMNDGGKRQLNIGYIATVYHGLLPSTLTVFQEQHPHIEVNLFDMTSAQQLQALEARSIDLGFIGLRESITGASLDGVCVANYDVMVALPKGNAVSKKSSIALTDLRTFFFAGLSETSYPGFREWFQNVFSVVGFTPRVLQVMDSRPAILRFVASGLGVALLPDQTGSNYQSGVVVRPLTPRLRAESWIAWRADSRSKPLSQYVDIVRAAASAHMT